MEKTKYRDLIMRYLLLHWTRIKVITTEQVAQYVAEQLQLRNSNSKKDSQCKYGPS